MFLVKFQLADFNSPVTAEQQKEIKKVILGKSQANYSKWDYAPEGMDYTQWVKSLGFSVDGLVDIKCKTKIIELWTEEIKEQVIKGRRKGFENNELNSFIDAEVKIRYNNVFKGKEKFNF